jgi:hypothetical protein
VFGAVANVQFAKLPSRRRDMLPPGNTLFKAGITDGGALWFSTADSCRRKKLIFGLRRTLSFAISAPRGNLINA